MQALFIFFLIKNSATDKIFIQERDMNNTFKFLVNVFSVAVALSYGNILPLYAEDDQNPQSITIDSDIFNKYKDYKKMISVGTTTKELCPEGQYVYKCGNYKVGFNWLRGIQKLNSEDDTTSASTANYYISTSQSELLDQMRDFFNPSTDSNYKSIEYCTSGTGKNCTRATRSQTDHLTDRELILLSLCDPNESNMTVTCATCPNSANVPASSVDVTEDLNGAKSASNWVFHTIADCYLKEFTDSTGTYEYRQNDTAQECYYTNTNPEAFRALQGDNISGTPSSLIIDAVVPVSVKTLDGKL